MPDAADRLGAGVVMSLFARTSGRLVAVLFGLAAATACKRECPVGSAMGPSGLCTLPPADDVAEAAAAVGLSEDAAEVALTMRSRGLPDSPTNRMAEDPDAAALGHFLFYDARLSRSGLFRCANCHDPHQDFHDGKRISDDGESLVHRNTPTATNGPLYQWLYWGGRCDSLWCQAANPIENDLEMNSTRVEVAHVLYDDPDLHDAYEALYGPLPDMDDPRFPATGRPDPKLPDSEDARSWDAMAEADQLAVSEVLANVAKSLAAYERKLARIDAPFDTFVDGLEDGDPDKLAVLSPAAVRGLELFVGDAGCTRCHAGPFFTTEEHVNTGLGTRAWLLTEDTGRWEGHKELMAEDFSTFGPWSDDPSFGAALLERIGDAPTEADFGAYRTPSLRNVGLSAPYMHGGHFDTLDEVLEFYIFLDESPVYGERDERVQPLDLTPGQAADLVAFLNTLTGERPDEALFDPPESPWAD
jgi:cytochrome c peroxidase